MVRQYSDYEILCCANRTHSVHDVPTMTVDNVVPCLIKRRTYREDAEETRNAIHHNETDKTKCEVAEGHAN